MADERYTAQEIDEKLVNMRNDMIEKINRTVITNLTPDVDPDNSDNSLILNVVSVEEPDESN